MVPIIFWDFQELEINGKKYFQQSIINKQSWQTTHNIVPFQPSGHDRKERQYFCRKVWILIGVTWYWKSATYQSGLFLQILWRSHHNTVYLSTKNSTICNMKREWKNKPLLSFFHESQSCFLNCFYMSSILINLQMEVSKWNKFPRFTADCFLFASPHSVWKSSKNFPFNF